MIPGEDAFFKKAVSLKFAGRTLRFRVSQSLFSSHDVDAGTRLLLQSLLGARIGERPQVLDVGCGYGPIGIALKALLPLARVELTDRDALALSYARQNAALNEREGVEAYASLGYDDVRQQAYDLVVLNLPGKAGERVIRHLVMGAVARLAPGGRAAFVMVSPLTRMVAQTLREDPAVRVVHEEARRSHSVAHVAVDGALRDVEPARGFEAGVYDRATALVPAAGRSLELRTVFGLPEFDTPSFATQLLVEDATALLRAGSSVRHAVMLEPGQGHAAVLVQALARPERMTLAGRDLLSLRCARRNLLLNGAAATSVALDHGVRFAPARGEQAELIVGVLREDDGVDAHAQALRSAAEALPAGGVMLIAASSTAAVRAAKRLAGERRVRERRRRKGAVTLIIEG